MENIIILPRKWNSCKSGGAVVAIAIAMAMMAGRVLGGNKVEEQVRVECGLTRFPDLCIRALAGIEDPNVDMMSALVKKAIIETKLPESNFQKLTSHFISSEAQQARIAMDDCQELMEMSVRRLNQALEALRRSPEKYKSDIQTFLSAAITFHETCKDSVKDHIASNVHLGEIYRKMDFLSELGSNPLALVNRINESNPSSSSSGRRVLEVDDGFPSWVSPADRRLLQSTQIKANAVVAKDGSGNFKTVSEAIQAAGGGGYVIYVKAGTYSERINTNKDGITLIGDGKYSTIITGSGSVGNGASLRGSATFAITGDRFIARDIGFQNSAGPSAEQAVALTVVSDHSVFFRCSIAGNQDTLYAHSLRQFYRECDIFGTVDFIFGNAAAVFQSCTLALRSPRSGGAYNVIMANGRTDPGQNTGFSVHNSRITVASGSSSGKSSYLGRPWKQYSRAVVMQSNIDGAISSRGWVEWPGAGGSTYKTLYFAEYQNMGAGAGTSGRVKWPGFHVIATPEASKFTVANFIGGTSWLPSTGVTFVAGLQ
ncbi:pectinesterase-like [Andrographis paniculata]|uniref:pectinesterase-like n=1 Tax=Andrographis paniculata TaxID=175694 RepID=UPI0021E6EEF0|nr:pectinesterase-like [Andrographis paniculata]